MTFQSCSVISSLMGIVDGFADQCGKVCGVRRMGFQLFRGGAELGSLDGVQTEALREDMVNLDDLADVVKTVGFSDADEQCAEG